MDSLVTRLRKPWFTNGCAAYQLEAADHIEKLETALRDICGIINLSPETCAAIARTALEQNP